jgi:hypothetical protein
MKETIFIHINIVTSGNFVGIHEIACISYCVGDMYGNIHENDSISFHLTKEIDPNFKDKITRLPTTVIKYTKYVGIVVFLSMIEEYEKKNKNIYFTSEYATDTLGWINYYMCAYLPVGRKRPIYLDQHNNKRMIIDVYSFNLGNSNNEIDATDSLNSSTSSAASTTRLNSELLSPVIQVKNEYLTFVVQVKNEYLT